MHITDIQIYGRTPNCIVIKNFVWKFTFATAISGNSIQPNIQYIVKYPA